MRFHIVLFIVFHSIKVATIYSFFTLPISFKWRKIGEIVTLSLSGRSGVFVCRLDSTNVLSWSLSLPGFRYQSSSRSKSQLQDLVNLRRIEDYVALPSPSHIDDSGFLIHTLSEI